MTSTCSSVVGRFDGHGSAPEQYRQHRPMRHVQGYSESHWMPPLGNYLLCIAPAAARATGKQTTIKKYTYKAGPFNGHVDAPVRNHTHRPMEEVQGFTRSCTGLRYWASIMSNNINGTWLRRFFSMFFIDKTEGKGHGLMLRPLFFIGV